MASREHQPVLIIDEDADLGRRLAQEITQLGFRTAVVTLANERIAEFLVPFVPGLVVVDPDHILERHRPQDWIVQSLRSRFPAAGVVVQTQRYSLADCFRCAQTGAAAYLPKPMSAAQMLAFLSRQPTQLPARMAPEAPLSLARMEWEHINRVLVACRGNKTRAAALLDIPRFTLQRKLRKHPPPAEVRAA